MRTISSLAVAAAVAIAAGAAHPAAQQQDETTGPRITGWSFTPQVRVGTLFDSNIGLTAPRADVRDTQSDTLLMVEPAGTLKFLGKYTQFSGQYSGFIRRYREVEGLDTFSQGSEVSLRHAVTRFVNVFANNSFADAPTTDEVEVNGVPFRRVGSKRNTFAGGVNARLSKYMTLNTRYDYTWVSFDRPDEPDALTGGWIQNIGGGLQRRMSERASVGGEYAFRWAKMDDGRELRFQDVGGTIDYQLAPHTTVSGAAGVSFLHDLLAAEHESGLYFRAALTQQTEHATLGASFARQFLPSFGFGGSSASQEARGWVTAPFYRNRMYVNASAAWRRSVPFKLSDALQLDSYWVRSTLGYSVARWADVEGFYVFTRQNVFGRGGEINRHRVGVQVVLAQPMRIQ